MLKKGLHIGVMGAGSFASFAVKAFLKNSGVQLVAVTDTDQAAAIMLATEYGAVPYTDVGAFLKDDRTDLVYIATPPYLHYTQSKQALEAGKHVICEKPAALKTSEAKELQALAASLQLLYVVNLMQRYNLLYTIVKTIVQEKMMGNFLHGFFENYASDENLDAAHWFWDERKSGGIFIEHGVHFFDLFSGWLGEGEVVNALQLQRPTSETNMVDRVQATVLYNGRLVNFYHGFDQPAILDRQVMRLQFERGEITLYEWVPVKMKLHGLLKKEEVATLFSLLDGPSVYHHKQVSHSKGARRFKEVHYDEQVTVEYGNASEKSERYQQLLTAMIKDQWDWIKDRSHKRVIDGNNAIASLMVAEEATRMAKNSNS